MTINVTNKECIVWNKGMELYNLIVWQASGLAYIVWPLSLVKVLGKCPTVSIDKTDGCQVFLSKDSLKCEIITAKSSEMNICIPPKDGTGDFVSFSIVVSPTNSTIAVIYVESFDLGLYVCVRRLSVLSLSSSRRYGMVKLWSQNVLTLPPESQMLWWSRE